MGEREGMTVGDFVGPVDGRGVGERVGAFVGMNLWVTGITVGVVVGQ